MTILSELIDRTANRLSMVAGTGVQTYAEDRIAEMIQHKFDVLFDEAFWPQFCVWDTWTLDGTLGVVTKDLTELVKRYDDVQVMYPENSNSPIIKLSQITANPFEFSGTTPLRYEGLSGTSKLTRVIQFWPKSATGNINVRYRTKPDTFTATDDVDFDDQILILGATYDYLEDDGTNPNATQKFLSLFESRKDQLIEQHNSGPIALDSNSPALSTTSSFTEL